MGPTLGTAIYNFYSSPKKVFYTQYNLTVLFPDLEKFEMYMVLALKGPPPGPPCGPHEPFEQP